jgi:hypothetical protein
MLGCPYDQWFRQFSHKYSNANCHDRGRKSRVAFRSASLQCCGRSCNILTDIAAVLIPIFLVVETQITLLKRCQVIRLFACRILCHLFAGDCLLPLSTSPPDFGLWRLINFLNEQRIFYGRSPTPLDRSLITSPPTSRGKT